ncbi:MAG: Fic family protein [Bacteroidia bacterium]|jgi:Fic family protein|nr:Fic family protein [Bacteroidia bacterium]
MTKKDIPVWKFISFDDTWTHADVSRLDELAPAWFNRKQEFENHSEAYKKFIDQVKRRHAIETGVIEHLYDISTGLTETLVEKGIHDTLITHDDQLNGVTKEELFDHLRDHMNAIDYIFDFIKSNRELSKSYIKEIHALLTKHQQWTEGRDQFGNKTRIPLLHGKFKEKVNNPSRLSDDGQTQLVFLYCPPEHVDSEIEKLLSIYSDLEQKQIHPVIIAAWFHHAFSIIHPFQDGNGRMCRLLASLILIKHGYFPFTIVRIDKLDYIDALIEADKGNPAPLVNVVAERQCALIEEVLEISPENNASIDDLADILAKKVNQKSAEKDKLEQLHISQMRNKVFAVASDFLNEQVDKLRQKLPQTLQIRTDVCQPDDEIRNYYHTFQIGEYASKHNYYFNRNKSRGWMKLSIEIKKGRIIQLVISLHHFGYAEDSVAWGGFIYYEQINENQLSNQSFQPLDLKPLKLSLDIEADRLNPKNITSYINDQIVTFLSILTTEI